VLVLCLIEQMFLPLFLLARDINNILQLCQPCSLSINVLSSGFGALRCCLPPRNEFLFLTEPLYFLLYPGQPLLLYCYFIFIVFFVSVLHVDLIKLDVALVGLYRRRCPRW
jgi:hypothetical protein